MQIVRASALLGYVPVGNMGLVLLATRIRDVLTLPGGHVVKLVVESKWFTVPLQVPHSSACYAANASHTMDPPSLGPDRRHLQLWLTWGNMGPRLAKGMLCVKPKNPQVFPMAQRNNARHHACITTSH